MDENTDRSDKAVAKFSQGYNCAQSVLYAFYEDLNLDKDKALKLACGFGAGMGRQEEVCGAVSGGIMVIGAKYGRGENEDKETTYNAYVKIRELMNQFSQRHGTYICRQLLNGCELTTQEGQATYKANEYFNKVCRPCVKSVVEILENIMKTEQ
jgi:C_GCAxxG_C_C family probable redox protein